MKKQSILDNLFINTPNPHLNTTVFFGDIFAGLQKLESASIDCAITSPPYFDQRDYGFSNQIGNENSLDDYLSKLNFLFSILRDKLRPQGIFFLNIGDKYLAKYGNSSLGLIPYKLAFLMKEKSNWILEDILIWYKPNHMPSSVKNRFTNTYEPVFVFSKHPQNYYQEFKTSNSYNQVLKVPLQQTKYAHTAVFPEKLVHRLLQIITLPDKATVLDPFCGTGTVLKCVHDLLKNELKNHQSIGIESQRDYVTIIKERCNVANESIKKVNFIPYKYPVYQIDKEIRNIDMDNLGDLGDHDFSQSFVENSRNPYFELKFDVEKDDLLVCLPEQTYITKEVIKQLEDKKGKIIGKIDDEGLFFLGMPTFNLELLLKLSQVEDILIRNVLISVNEGIRNKKRYYATIFIVKDTKLVKYIFNLDNIRSTTLNKANFDIIKDFIGLAVVQSTTITKEERKGVVIDIQKRENDKFPIQCLVKWENGEITRKSLINHVNTNNYYQFSCPKCKKTLTKYFKNRELCSCEHCSFVLWQDHNSIPILSFTKDIFNSPYKTVKKQKKYEINVHKAKNKVTAYTGKFKNLKSKKNRGQSPGARLLTEEQYFFVKRFFIPKHGLFATYLSLKRKQKGLSIQQITETFPKSYKHTVGHWFRTDMGGSLPKLEDLDKLAKILELDNTFVTLVKHTGIKFQSVLNHKKGKNPGDYLKMSKENLVQMFQKLVM